MFTLIEVIFILIAMESLIALSKYLGRHQTITITQCLFIIPLSVFVCWFLMVVINDWINGHLDFSRIIDGGFIFGGLIVSVLLMGVVIGFRKYDDTQRSGT